MLFHDFIITKHTCLACFVFAPYPRFYAWFFFLRLDRKYDLVSYPNHGFDSASTINNKAVDYSSELGLERVPLDLRLADMRARVSRNSNSRSAKSVIYASDGTRICAKSVSRVAITYSVLLAEASTPVDEGDARRQREYVEGAFFLLCATRPRKENHFSGKL